MNTFKKTGGFTLVELIIVIAILAILSSVAVAGYSTYIKRANDSAVEAELGNIATAAVLANAESGEISGIKVEMKDNTWTVTITAAKFDAEDFDDLFLATISGAKRTDTDGDTNGRVYELTSKANYAASKDYTGGVANWTNNEWKNS